MRREHPRSGSLAWAFRPSSSAASCGGSGCAAQSGGGDTGCHGWVHRHVAEAERLGLIVPFGMDPLAIPVRDWRGKWFRLNQDGTAVALTQTEIILLQTKGNQQ